MTRKNAFGQPIGPPLEWRPPLAPKPVVLAGKHVRLKPISGDHAAGILNVLAPHPELWTYRRDDPPTDPAEAAALIERLRRAPDVTLAVIHPTDESFHGMLTMMRADPAHGSVEIGAIIYSPAFQRTPATTEATQLVATYVFRLVTGAWSGSATVSTNPLDALPPGWGSPRRAPFAMRPSTKPAAATPPGSPSPTPSGPGCARPTAAGSTRPISTRRATS